ncbi:SEC-C domain-containing protein [Herbaspirillum sp.]|uniref:YecA family protein n=1 Tax=Herbaspirillum sp. TaxID=1890675 RepID=UPI0031D862C9
MNTRTPPEINKHIARLIHKVAQGQQPVYLDVIPEPGAIVNECYANVTKKLEIAGGEVVYGWQLWEWPHVMVEAEFHAVWRAPEGTLHELTPKADGEQRILFLPDPHRIYTGTPIDNVRLAIRDDLLVHDFITVSEEITKVRIRSGIETQPGMIGVPSHEINPLLNLQGLICHMLLQNLRANAPCACGSGRKYKRCHGASVAAYKQHQSAQQFASVVID